MSFEPASPISIITCEKCQGSGCSACNQQGIYGLQENQPIVFNLPSFIDLKSRRFFKKILLVKRLVLILAAATIIILSWSFFYA